MPSRYDRAARLPQPTSVITPSDNNAYQNALDEALLGQADAEV
jgi:hypothetical protein